MPHQLMENLDGCFLLPAPPGHVFDEVPHHFKVLESSTPVFPRKHVWVPVDKAALLGSEGSLEVVPEAHRITEGDVIEEQVEVGASLSVAPVNLDKKFAAANSPDKSRLDSEDMSVF